MVTKNNYYTIRHWGLDIVSASHPSGTAYKRKLPSQAVTTQKFKINSKLGVSAHAQYPERNELRSRACTFQQDKYCSVDVIFEHPIWIEPIEIQSKFCLD